MRRKGSLLRELPILVVVALVVSLLIKTFLVQFFYIPSGSMENTLQIKDRVAVNKVPFLSRNIARGDVVVFRDPAGWLPEMIDYSTNKYVAKLKTGLVAVGVLPNPAKQYLVKRVIGVGGDRIVCCDKAGLLTVNRPALSQQTTRSPPTPMTRLTKYCFAGLGKTPTATKPVLTFATYLFVE